MENASKALLIAGGVLIALIIMSLLVVAFTKIGDYQKAQSEGSRDSQLAEFNRDFERYTEDDIRGVDIVSLINKIDDYNTKRKRILSSETATDSTTVDYNIEIKLNVNLSNFNTINAYDGLSSNDKLFVSDLFTYDGNSTQGNTLKKELDKCQEAEYTLSIETLKKLSNKFDHDKNKRVNKDNIKEVLKEIDSKKYENWDGNSPSPSLNTIAKYMQYSEFKNGKFKANKDPVYKNGQICELSFEYVD